MAYSAMMIVMAQIISKAIAASKHSLFRWTHTHLQHVATQGIFLRDDDCHGSNNVQSCRCVEALVVQLDRHTLARWPDKGFCCAMIIIVMTLIIHSAGHTHLRDGST